MAEQPNTTEYGETGNCVASKIKTLKAPDPWKRPPAEDPWDAFREVELISLDWEQHYRHSLGKTSRFFLALEQGQLLATHCTRCGFTWMPPRPVCARCLSITSWVELSGRGRLASYTVQYYAPAFVRLDAPFVLATVELDGADTLFMHLLRGYGALQDVQVGMPVHVTYAAAAVQHPLHLMWFEPFVEETGWADVEAGERWQAGV